MQARNLLVLVWCNPLSSAPPLVSCVCPGQALLLGRMKPPSIGSSTAGGCYERRGAAALLSSSSAGSSSESPTSTIIKNPTATFHSLPDVAHFSIAAYLQPTTLDLVASCCRVLLHNPHFNSSSRVIHYHQGAQDDNGSVVTAHASSLKSLLQRGVVREVQLNSPALLGPFCQALRDTHCGKAVRSLIVNSACGSPLYATGEEEQWLADAMLGQLPALERLSLMEGCCTFSSLNPWEKVWQALGQGACPALKSLGASDVYCGLSKALEERDHHSASDGPQVMQGGAGAVVAAAGITDLRLYGGNRQEVRRLLQCKALASLESLGLTGVGTAGVGSFLRGNGSASDSSALRSLHIMSSESPCDGEELAAALAAGCAPLLQDLLLVGVSWSVTDLSPLAASLTAHGGGGGGGALLWLKELTLVDVFEDPNAMHLLLDAMANGHGWPHLETLTIGTGEMVRWLLGGADAGKAARVMNTALLQLLGSTHGGGGSLPSLRRLTLIRVPTSIFSGLGHALLVKRPPGNNNNHDDGEEDDGGHDTPPLEQLALKDCEVLEGPGLDCEEVAIALQARALLPLKTLDLARTWLSAASVTRLMQTLGTGGVARELQRLSLRDTGLLPDALHELFKALVVGACPALQELDASTSENSMLPPGHALDMCTVLSGGAACSSTLRLVNVDGMFTAAGDLSRVTAATAEPGAVNLEQLGLSCGVDSVENVANLIAALASRHGSRSRLRELTLAFVMMVQQRGGGGDGGGGVQSCVREALTKAIRDDGAWPCMETCFVEEAWTGEQQQQHGMRRAAMMMDGCDNESIEALLDARKKRR